MEHPLALNDRPYDPAEPYAGVPARVCFDERPCFLIGDTVLPLPMDEGRPRREHYEYEKFGSFVLMVGSIRRPGGASLRSSSGAASGEYVQFVKAVASHYATCRPEVRRVHLVQDNLNTQHAGSFYEQFDAATAHGLEQFYQLHYAPRRGSWLNMAEIDISAISRQGLTRRIASQSVLEREVLALTAEHNGKQITIQWQFSGEKARQKLNRDYKAAHPGNIVYQRAYLTVC